jgi:deazaflavin-dependent oxidoreductase (nitroreductase family)
MVTARGAKTGMPRDVPLIGVPIDDGIILVASNWGHATHPAWYRNLTKEHTATVSYHGEARTYFVQETEGDLRSRCWAKAVEVYPGYEAYRRRAAHRQIPVILLTPEQT